MCAACAVNGLETQCPTCRDLNPIGFPYDANADLNTLWSHATSGFQRELAMIVVAVLIYFAFAFGGGVVSNIINRVVGTIVGVDFDPANPFKSGLAWNLLISQIVAILVNIPIQGVGLVGLYRVLMDVLVGKKADLARMFSQLHLLANYVVMHVIIFFVITVPTLIYFGIVGLVGLRIIDVDWNHLSEFRPERLAHPAFLALIFASMVVFLAAMVVILPVSLFATPELIVGQCSPVEALKRAWDLGNGQRLRTFGYSFVAGLLYILGAFCCGVGMIFTMPIALMLILSLFLALRRSAPLPPAIHT
ncbi:MAG: hypothetical protein Q8L48_11430 [Archangium sp.]|nr:hypothetical protein [Archangium sp.]